MNETQTSFELTEAKFLRLFVKHEPTLRVYARSIVPDWSLVDEAIQEASVVMWQKRKQLREEDGFAPWAKVILRFKCLRQIEKLRLERPILSDAMIATLASRREEKGQEIDVEKAEAFQECFAQLSYSPPEPKRNQQQAQHHYPREEHVDNQTNIRMTFKEQQLANNQ